MKRIVTIGLVALLGCLIGLTSAQAEGPSATSWVVHRPVDIANIERGPNRVTNPGFESGATGWIRYGEGFAVDEDVSHGGSRSIRIGPGDLSAAVQQVDLNQSFASPIHIGGWSKAQGAPGGCTMHYSIYVDITYMDGTQPYSPWYCFEGGTHDWEHVEGVLFPEKPVATIHIWTMLSGGSGTAWFDDLTVGEYAADIREFDANQIIYGAPESGPWQGSQVLRLNTADGLSLGLSALGGALTSLQLDGHEQAYAEGAHASGFFVRDVAADSSYVHLGGTVSQQGEALLYEGADSELGLELVATFRSAGDHIVIDASLRDTTGEDRAISLYFALPIPATDRIWWRDIRVGDPADSQSEHRVVVETDWGANGAMSQYCLSSLSSQIGQSGLALAYPMDRPVVSRFAYNSATYSYYFVADVGLSSHTQPQPSQADVQLLLYRHDPEWGFRAAFEKYVSLYPEFFQDRVAEDGVWVAHAELEGIPDIADYGIRFHETGNSRVYAYDDSVDAYTLRYLTEPWGYWMHLPEEVSADDYGAVMDTVEEMLSDPAPNERRWAEAILSSGALGADSRYIYEGRDEAFATHVAAFVLNGEPDLALPGYEHTKATQNWNTSLLEPYSHPEWGILDGEYIDSFESRGLTSNYRTEHWQFADHPLTFGSGDRRVVLPHIWSNFALAKEIADEIHALDRYVMGNGLLLRWAFPAHLFDVMGSERGWVHEGRFLPDVDSLLNLWRTFSYRKPYCVLQNGDLPSYTQEMVEQYFAYCTFYGIYPSFFTHDGGVTNYWETPEWYERDRALHARYIPLIRDLNDAGWEPVTHARTDNEQVYIERYGRGESFYLTLRNASQAAIECAVSVDLTRLGLSSQGNYQVSELLAGQPVTVEIGGSQLVLGQSLPAGATRILQVGAPPAETHQIDLVTGWNLVSIPGLTLSQRATDLFAPLAGHADRIDIYDADSSRLLSFYPDAHGASEFHTVRPGQGFWVHALSNVTWSVTCVAQTQATLSLSAGWNLVGLPFGDSLAVTAAIAGLDERFRTLYGYDASAPALRWRSFAWDVPDELNSLQVIEPGRGYWIEVSESVEWAIPR